MDDITEPISSGYRPIPDSKQAFADVGLRHIRIGHLPGEQPHPHTQDLPRAEVAVQRGGGLEEFTE